jgi:quinol monooxygenase YgiN
MTRSLYAEFTVIPGNEDRVRELLTELTVKVRAEPGNIAFEPYTLESDSSHYFVFEIYKDEHAFAEHIAQEHGKHFNAELSSLVAGGASALTWLVPLHAS